MIRAPLVRKDILSRFRLVDRRPTGAPFTVSENGTSGFKEGAQACGGFVIMKSY